MLLTSTTVYILYPMINLMATTQLTQFTAAQASFTLGLPFGLQASLDYSSYYEASSGLSIP